MTRWATISALLALIGSPAAAQEAGAGWDLTIDETQHATLAVAADTSGRALVVRCVAGQLDVLVAGLAPLSGVSRYIEATWDEGPMEAGFWLADGMTAFSPTPAQSARQLRKSGALNLSVATGPEPDSPLDQYTFELPAASAAVDRVLEACGAPTTDARDDLPRWNPPRTSSSSMWNRRPVPDFPASALSAGINSGFAILSCVVGAQGQFLDCRVERESHRRAGFGDAALRSMRAARLSLTDGQAPRVGDLIVSTIRFRAS